jgi:hypothetical protein
MSNVYDEGYDVDDPDSCSATYGDGYGAYESLVVVAEPGGQETKQVYICVRVCVEREHCSEWNA